MANETNDSCAPLQHLSDIKKQASHPFSPQTTCAQTLVSLNAPPPEYTIFNRRGQKELMKGPFTHTHTHRNSQPHAKYINIMFYNDSHKHLFLYDSMHRHINADTTQQLHAWNQLTVFSARDFPLLRLLQGEDEKEKERNCSRDDVK